MEVFIQISIDVISKLFFIHVIFNKFEKKTQCSFTFITQLSMKAVYTTIKASSIKSVTGLVVTVRTAWMHTVFSIRLDTFYNYTKIQY